ncbi:MAG: hypothetical protein HC804_03735, partial [Anaerolineae bacterium]|nr:hypothetical protein [Anaerolineae bacterium]
MKSWPTPDPSAGLPNAEWLELFNRSSKTIDLATLRIQDATSAPVQLPTFLFQPQTYIALTAPANAAALQAATSGTVLAAPISTTMLNNDGDVLTLSNLTSQVIDRVAYSVDWHSNSGKAEGGWTLERINPNLPCLGGENWQSCPSLPGGTLGAQNASFQNLPDDDAPRLLSAFPESATSLLLVFSEGLDKNTAQNPAAYYLAPPRNIASAEQLPTDRAQVRLTLADPLQTATVYALTVETSVTDCSGNAVAATDTIFWDCP